MQYSEDLIYSNMLDINVKHLLYFISVAENQSITLAAQKLFVTQPYLSKVISSLEMKLDVVLFERGAKKTTLTEMGKLFYERMLPIVDMALSSVSELQARKALGENVLNLGVVYDMDVMKLSNQNFIQNCPFDTTKIITYHNFFSLLDGIQAGSLDAAIIWKNYMEHFHECRHVSLGITPACAIVSQEHRFSKKHQIQTQELEDEVICFYIERLLEHKHIFNPLSEYCLKNDININNAMFANNYQTALLNAQAGNAILIGSIISQFPDSGSLRAIPIEGQSLEIVMVYSQSLSDEKMSILKALV